MKYDSTEKHIIAHGRMSNLVYKYFYSTEFKVYGKVVGTADDHHFICEFMLPGKAGGKESAFVILTIDQMSKCIFSTFFHGLQGIVERNEIQTIADVFRHSNYNPTPESETEDDMNLPSEPWKPIGLRPSAEDDIEF